MILSDLAIEFSKRCFDVCVRFLPFRETNANAHPWAYRDPDARASASELLQHPYLMLEPEWVFTGFK